MSDELNVLSADGLNRLPLGERCRSLRCKGMYLNYGLSEEERVTGDGHFWCSRTQIIVGPDQELVGDVECRHTGRACYDSPT